MNGASVIFQQNELPLTKADLLVTDPPPMLNFSCVNTKGWHWTLTGVWYVKDILRGRLLTLEFFHLGGGSSDHVISIHIWDFILLKERFSCFFKSIKRIHNYLWGISGLSIITDKPFGLISLDSSFSGYEVGQWVSYYHFPVESLYFYLFIYFLFVVDFVIHWNETALGLHVFPILIPPPTSLSTCSL